MPEIDKHVADTDLYEVPYHEVRRVTTWTLPLLLSASVIFVCMSTHYLIEDIPRHFDYGAYEDVPGQSVYAIQAVPERDVAEPQMQPLPDSIPLAAQHERGPQR